jgi:hypothetical protein
VIPVATVLINPRARTHATEPTDGGEGSLNYMEETVENKYFTALDGTVYVSKSYFDNVIHKILEKFHKNKQCECFAKLLIEELDACYYREQIPDIKNPDVDYFYCGGCRRGFPVAYTAEMARSDIRPCPTCGAQATVTPKLGKGENDETDNTEGSRS